MRLSAVQIAYLRRRADAEGITLDAYIARIQREQDILDAQRALTDERCYQLIEFRANQNGRAFTWGLA